MHHLWHLNYPCINDDRRSQQETPHSTGASLMLSHKIFHQCDSQFENKGVPPMLDALSWQAGVFLDGKRIVDEKWRCLQTEDLIISRKSHQDDYRRLAGALCTARNALVNAETSPLPATWWAHVGFNGIDVWRGDRCIRHESGMNRERGCPQNGECADIYNLNDFSHFDEVTPSSSTSSIQGHIGKKSLQTREEFFLDSWISEIKQVFFCFCF